jgi:hypothetical protein
MEERGMSLEMYDPKTLQDEARRIAPALKKAIEDYREGKISRTAELDMRIDRIERWYDLLLRVCEEGLDEDTVIDLIYLKGSETSKKKSRGRA